MLNRNMMSINKVILVLIDQEEIFSLLRQGERGALISEGTGLSGRKGRAVATGASNRLLNRFFMKKNMLKLTIP